MNTNNKIHSDSKIESCNNFEKSADDVVKIFLPPPPSSGEKICRIPPPPCGIIQQQPPPLRSSSSSRSSSSRQRRSFRKQSDDDDDPFLIAYKECTKSSKKDDWESKLINRKSRDSIDDDGVGLIGLKKSMSIFSCKLSSCNVTEDNIVKVSKRSNSRTQ